MTTETIEAPVESDSSTNEPLSHCFHTCQTINEQYIPVGAKAICGYIKETDSQEVGKHYCVVCKEMFLTAIFKPCPLCGKF